MATELESTRPSERSAVVRLQHQAIGEFVSSLYGDEESSDLVLAVPPCSRFFVHKLVMSQSPVFRSMLYGSNWKESGAQTITVNEDDKYVSDIEIFLMYMYGLPVNLTWRSIESLFYFGDKYVVDSLPEKCLGYLIDNAKKNSSLRYALDAWMMARRVLNHHHHHLRSLERVIFCNIDLLMKSEDMVGSIDQDDLEYLLTCDSLVCRTEFTVYKIVETWIMLQEESRRLDYLRKFYRLVRLPHMHIPELSYVEKLPMRLFPDESCERHNQCNTTVKMLLCDAYRYHLFSQEERNNINMTVAPPREIGRAHV